MADEKKDGEDTGAEEEKGEEEEDIESEDEVLDDSKYEPEKRQPWKTKDERATFFKEKKAGKVEEEEEGVEKSNEDIIREETRNILTPVIEGLRSSADETEIANYLIGHPDHRKYEKLARKDAKAYPNTPISKIFKALAHDDLLSSKPKPEETKKKPPLRGSTSRPVSTGKMPDLSTPEKVRAFNARIEAGEKVSLTED